MHHHHLLSTANHQHLLIAVFWIVQVVQGQKQMEGAGVRICRTIGTGALRNLDPFLMLVSNPIVDACTLMAPADR